MGGKSEPQGYALKVRTETIRRQSLPSGHLNWVRIYIPELVLSQSCHLAFLQGEAPVRFFLASSLTGKTEQPGPLLYLRGVLSLPWESPARFRGLVLARLLRLSGDDQNVGVADAFNALSLYESKRRPG